MGEYSIDIGTNFPEVKKLNKYLKGTKGFIAGGCFKNVFKGQKIRDIDIYFESHEDWENGLDVIDRRTSLKYKYENENCVGYWDKKEEVLVEVIKSIFGTPQEVMDRFDFTVVKAAYREKPESVLSEFRLGINSLPTAVSPDIKSSRPEYQFLYHPKFFEHLMLNRLIIDDAIEKPVATLNRSWKYAKYGYGLCRESKVKLVEAVMERGVVDEISSDLYFGFD